MIPSEQLYVGVFCFAVAGCLAAVPRVLTLDHGPTRRGLLGLVLTAGGWGVLQAVRPLAGGLQLKLFLYQAGLTCGLLAIGGWLYFCSAYTGHDYHRRLRYRATAISLFVVVAGVKFTNPVHGWYFDASIAGEPFARLAIAHHALHWAVIGAAYLLAAAGFLLLFGMLARAEHGTTPLGLLVGAAGLPIVVDVAAVATPGHPIAFNYEPLGVAVFAVGALYLDCRSFRSVRRFGSRQVVDRLSEAVVIVGEGGELRAHNERADELFPQLAVEGTVTEASLLASATEWEVEGSLAEGGVAVSPADERTVAAAGVPAADETIVAAADDVRLLTVTVGKHPRHLLRTETEISLVDNGGGRLVVFTDVTTVERQGWRHQEQLDDGSDGLTGALGDGLRCVAGARTAPGRSDERVATVAGTTGWLERVADDIAYLARWARGVEAPQRLHVGAVVEQSVEEAALGDIDIVVDQDGTVEASEPRLRALFRTAFEAARAQNAATVRLRVEQGRLALAHDGDRIEDAAAVFEYGTAVPDAASGVLYPNVRTLARAHGWSVTATSERAGGVRLTIEASTARLTS